MAEPFLGEIRILGFNFAPRGYALCDGQLLSISQNDALFSILGTTYGGDGRTTFGLPDLRGRVPIHNGNPPGPDPNRQNGVKGGTETQSLAANEVPAHNHSFSASGLQATSSDPADKVLAVRTFFASPHFSTIGPNNAMRNGVIGTAGGSGGAHNNMQPFGVVNYAIALQGVFPSRN